MVPFWPLSPKGGWSLLLDFVYHYVQVLSQGDQQPLQLKNRTGERGDFPLLWLVHKHHFPVNKEGMGWGTGVGLRHTQERAT